MVDIPIGFSSGIAGDLAAIHSALEVLVYGIFPFLVATLLVVAFLRWFSRTFVDSALEDRFY